MNAVELISSFNSSGSNITGNKTLPAATMDVHPDFLIITSKLLCIIILVAGIIGNSLVLIVFGSRYSKLKGCEIFMISLAVADLLGTIALPTMQLHEMMGGNFQPIHDVGCKINYFLIITSVTVSSLTLVAITCDRFIIVKWPLRNRASLKFISFFVIFIWILGSGPGIIYLVGGNMRLLRLDNGLEICRAFISPRVKAIHTLITFTIQVAMPLILMAILYSLIIYELRKTTKTQLFCIGERQMVARYKRNQKAIKLLIVIIFVFFVCIIPANLFYLLYQFKLYNLTSVQVKHLIAALQMLQMTNSCVNPIIYSKLHTLFRKTTLKIFCSCCIEKIRNYDWAEFGETFKATVSTTFQDASMRLSKVSSRSRLFSGTLKERQHDGKQTAECYVSYHRGDCNAEGNFTVHYTPPSSSRNAVTKTISPLCRQGSRRQHEQEELKLLNNVN